MAPFGGQSHPKGSRDLKNLRSPGNPGTYCPTLTLPKPPGNSPKSRPGLTISAAGLPLYRSASVTGPRLSDFSQPGLPGAHCGPVRWFFPRPAPQALRVVDQVPRGQTQYIACWTRKPFIRPNTSGNGSSTCGRQGRPALAHAQRDGPPA